MRLDIESLKGYPVSYKLQRLRWWKKLSQKKFAKEIGSAQASVCKWERGEVKPREYILERIRLHYGLPQDFFIENEIESLKLASKSKKSG